MNRATLSIYDGQVFVGEIEDRGRARVVAYEAGKSGRIKIGTFGNRRVIGGRA